MHNLFFHIQQLKHDCKGITAIEYAVLAGGVAIAIARRPGGAGFRTVQNSASR